MNFRMLKKKYRKMYGQNPPKWMKERLIKTMVSPSEYRVITAIGIKANFMRAIFTVVVEQLEEIKRMMESNISPDCFREECIEADCTICLAGKVIEIVKGGGTE